MQILLIALTLVTAIAINAAEMYEIIITNHQQLVLCVKAIVQRHFNLTHSITLSFTKKELDDNENTRSLSPYWEQMMTTDALLDSIHRESRWYLYISRPKPNYKHFVLNNTSGTTL
jgi:hypothetical protein